MNLTDTLSWVRRTMTTRRHEVRSGHNADTDLRTTGYIRERGSDAQEQDKQKVAFS